MGLKDPMGSQGGLDVFFSFDDLEGTYAYIYKSGSDDIKGIPAHIQVIRSFLQTNQQTVEGIQLGNSGSKNTEPQLSTLVCLSGNKMLRKEFKCVGNVIDGQFLTRVLPRAASGAGWAAALRRLIFQIYARH